MPTLFDPVRFGQFELPNRILMAPLTRGRADPVTAVPTPRMIEYYQARADAGLIITEATGISRQGLGWYGAPGLWTDAQVAGWQPIVAAVHARGGRILAQLWHMGRASHSDFNNGELPVAPSAIAIPDHTHTPSGKKPYEVPRALDISEIPAIIADYAHAAANAKRAGFDGVQVHGANGYLLDSFLRDCTNKRNDAYGGSFENRARFLLEAVAAVVDVWGGDRVSVRVSPRNPFNAMSDSDPHGLYKVVAEQLNRFDLAFLEAMDALPGQFFTGEGAPVHPVLRAHFKGAMTLNGGHTFATGTEALAAGEADAIVYGRPYISNPDLVARFKNGWPVTPDNMKTWYSTGDEGYNDYPTYAA